MPSRKESAKRQARGGNVLTLPPCPKIDLHDAHAIRREMGAVYRNARAGKIDPQDMNRFIYALECILRAYNACVLQDRLEQIEKTIEHDKD